MNITQAMYTSALFIVDVYHFHVKHIFPSIVPFVLVANSQFKIFFCLTVEGEMYRVKLRNKNHSGSDYINASFINVSTKAYVGEYT